MLGVKILVVIFALCNIVTEYLNHKSAEGRKFRNSYISDYFSGHKSQIQNVGFGIFFIALIAFADYYESTQITVLFYVAALSVAVLTLSWTALPNLTVHVVSAGVAFLVITYLEFMLLQGVSLIPVGLGFILALYFLFNKKREYAMAEKSYAAGLTIGLLLL